MKEKDLIEKIKARTKKLTIKFKNGQKIYHDYEWFGVNEKCIFGYDGRRNFEYLRECIDYFYGDDIRDELVGINMAIQFFNRRKA